MPTKPLEPILYRELSKVEAKEFIDIASPLLQELVNNATNVLARCADSTSNKVDEDVAILALYRHIIEMTDGIEVLISQSCGTPAVPLLRSSFEASLSIEYIVEKDAEYIRRSLAWLIGYIHKRLDMYERFDPSTQKGQEFKRLFDQDKTISGAKMPPSSKAQKAISNLESMLTKPHLRDLEREFNRYQRTPNWYQLFGGPPNLRALAEYLKRGAQYEFLYRQWSTTAHAQDLLPFLARTEEGKGAIGGLRSPGDLKTVASFASTFILNATRLILEKLRPGENFSNWYMEEVRDRYLYVTAANK